MNIDQAINIIEQACAAFTGNLKDHQAIQEALLTVKQHLTTSKQEQPNGDILNPDRVSNGQQNSG